MEGYDHDAAARTIKIEDITTDRVNREILRRLKENYSDFERLVVVCHFGLYRRDDDYCFKSANEVKWLGYYIGKNTTLQELVLRENPYVSDMISSHSSGG